MKRREFLQASTVGLSGLALAPHFAGLAELAPPPTGLAAAPDCVVTTADGEGPFYQANAPFRTRVALPEEPGERLWISGTVKDCRGRALENVVVEVWHANAAGCYSLNEACGVIPGQPDKFRLRAQFRPDSEGRYEFETIKPRHYGSRPSHIHYRVTFGPAPARPPEADAPRAQTELITQLYFEGDPLNETDWLARQPRARSRRISLTADTGRSGKQGVFNLVLPAAGESAAQAGELDYDLRIQHAGQRVILALPDDAEAGAVLELYHPGGQRLGEASFQSPSTALPSTPLGTSGTSPTLELDTSRVRPGLYLARVSFPGLAAEETLHVQL